MSPGLIDSLWQPFCTPLLSDVCKASYKFQLSILTSILVKNMVGNIGGGGGGGEAIDCCIHHFPCDYDLFRSKYLPLLFTYLLRTNCDKLPSSTVSPDQCDSCAMSLYQKLETVNSVFRASHLQPSHTHQRHSTKGQAHSLLDPIVSATTTYVLWEV